MPISRLTGGSNSNPLTSGSEPQSTPSSSSGITAQKGDGSGSASIWNHSHSGSSASKGLKGTVSGSSASGSSASSTQGQLPAALAQIRQDQQNPANKTQTATTSDGKTVLFRNVDGQAQFAVFEGGKQIAPASGWQAIDASENGGKGSLALGAGSYMNFDTKGFSLDSTAKNKGTPLGYDSTGNISVGGTSNELSDASVDAANDTSISGGTLQDAKINLYPSGTPSPSDIHQTELGDCYFDATLGALASTPKGQQQIQSMITPGATAGTYNVKMYDPSGKPVEIAVDGKSETVNGQLVGEASKDGTGNWGTVLESAYAKYNDMYHTNDATSGFAGIDHGSANTNNAVMALTGNPGQASQPISTMSPSSLGSYLTQALATNSSGSNGLTVGSPTEQKLPDGVHVVGPHAYSVIGFDPSTQTVTVRNPWGSADGNNSDGTPTAGDGTIKMSLADFQKCFNSTSSWSGDVNTSSSPSTTDNNSSTPSSSSPSVTPSPSSSSTPSDDGPTTIGGGPKIQ